MEEAKIPFRFKQNIVLVENDSDPDSPDRRVFVYDPDTQNKYDLGAEELFLLEQLKEDRTVTELQQNFKDTFQLALSEGNLSLFLKQMREYGLLEAGSADSIQKPPAGASPASSPPGDEPWEVDKDLLFAEEDVLLNDIIGEQKMAVPPVSLSVSGKPEGPPGRQGRRGRFGPRPPRRRPHQPEESLPVPPSGKKIKWKTIVLLLLIAVLAILPYHYEPGGEVTILPFERLEVFARAEGEVVKVNAKEGDLVTKGQILARISDWDLQKKIALTQLELEKKRARRTLLLEGAKPEEVELSRKMRDEAKIVSSYSLKEVERLTPLLKENSITGKQFDQTKTTADDARAALEVAEANLALVKSPPQKSELDIVEAEIRQLEQELVFYKEDLEKTLIKAPLDGRIITKNLAQFLGKFLEEGDLFSIVENSRTVKAVIMVPESDISLVEIGADSRIKVLADSTRYSYGKVSWVALYAEKAEKDPFTSVVRVEAQITNPDELLKTGATGYGKIDGGTMPVGIAFTRAIVQFVMIEMWSWLP